MRDLARMNAEEGRTVVVNIHDVDLAREYSTRIIALRAGRLVFDAARPRTWTRPPSSASTARRDRMTRPGRRRPFPRRRVGVGAR